MSEKHAVGAGRAPFVTGRQMRVDIGLAAGLFVAAVLSTALNTVAGVYGDDVADPRWGLVYAFALTAPLALRRRYPEAVAVAVALTYFIGMTARIPEIYVGNIAIFISMYTVGAWVDNRRRATAVRVAIIVGMFLWLIFTTFQAAIAPDDDGLSRAGLFSPFAAFMLIQFLINAAFFGGAYYMGDRAFAATQQRAALEQRTAELEREREVTAAQAVALDRVRIARELHDVVAHQVGAMGVQAGAARTILDRDPATARSALANIETSAREAIDELHRLLETLRTAEGDETVASTLRLDAVDELIAHARENGLPTTLTIVGDPAPLSDTAQVTAYRIVQEALTNARRHGGTEAEADVRIRFVADGVEIEITNTGRGATAVRPGLGILGMRERAAAAGGTVEIGPGARGGFRVRAHLPVTTTASAP